MNNKGQTLVLFIILLPIIFMVLSLIIDLGMLYAEKSKLENICESALKNALSVEIPDNQEIDEKVAVLIRKNMDNVKIDKIEVNDGVIYLSVSKEYKALFSKIFNRKENTISLKLKAYKENDGVVIKKE